MSRRRKNAPAYARAFVYTAHWPGREFRDQRLDLQRRYIGAMRKGNVKAARKIARTETYFNAIATLGRIPWGLIKIIRWAFAG